MDNRRDFPFVTINDLDITFLSLLQNISYQDLNKKKPFDKSKPCLTHWPEVAELCSIKEMPEVWSHCGLGRSKVVSQLDISLSSDVDRGGSCEFRVSFNSPFLSRAWRRRFFLHILNVLSLKVSLKVWNRPFLVASILFWNETKTENAVNSTTSSSQGKWWTNSSSWLIINEWMKSTSMGKWFVFEDTRLNCITMLGGEEGGGEEEGEERGEGGGERGGGGGERGDKKNKDAHWDILKRTPKRWPTSCLVGMDWMFFSRKSNTISFHKFCFKTLKDTAIAPTVDLFRLNTLTGTKTAFLTPKSTLYMGVPQINVANCKLTTTTVKTISML